MVENVIQFIAYLKINLLKISEDCKLFNLIALELDSFILKT